MVRRRGASLGRPVRCVGRIKGLEYRWCEWPRRVVTGTKGDLPWGIVHPTESDPPTAHKLEVTMKMVKSLLLGTAAGLVAVAGAQAADLPVKAKPVEYVKVCSVYGEGFFYVPGTDTCIKIGGYVRQDLYVGQASTSFRPAISSGVARLNRIDTAYSLWQSTEELSTDVRTQTEYGTLRAYTRVGFRVNSTVSENSYQYA